MAGAIACAAQAGYRLVPVEGPWIPRTEGTASLLHDGRVLLAGGCRGSASGPTSSTEIFDPATRRLSPGPSLVVPRTQHAAMTLPDGRVLMAGGSTLTYIVPTASAEIVHPDVGSQVIGDMALPRGGESLLVLGPDGSTFAFGGTQEGRFGQINDLVERLPPGATSWEPAGRLMLPCQGAWIRLDAERLLRLPGGSDRSAGHALGRVCASLAEEWRLMPRPTGRLIEGMAAPRGQGMLAGAWDGTRLLGLTTERAILHLDSQGLQAHRMLRASIDDERHHGPSLLAWGSDEVVLFGSDIRILHLASGRPDDVLEWKSRDNFTATVVSPDIILVAGGTEAGALVGAGTLQPPMLLIRELPPAR